MSDIGYDEAVLIAREFFKQSFAPFEIVDTVLQNSTWFVRGRLTTFGVQSNRMLEINSKTGMIIKCE